MMNEQFSVSEKKVYRYPFYLKIVPWVIFAVSSISLAILLFVSVINFSTEALLGCLLMLGVVLFTLQGCAYWSDIEIHEDGITLEFLVWYINIPWSNVIKIGQTESWRFKGLETWYVKVSGLNIAYKLVGLLSIGSFVPVFLVTNKLKNRKELIQEIRRRKPHHHDHSS